MLTVLTVLGALLSTPGRELSVVQFLKFSSLLYLHARCVSPAFDGQNYENRLQPENFGYLFQDKRLR